MMAPKAAEKGLQSCVEQSAELAQLPVSGDPLRLSQVLINLVGNAIKFTDQGAVTVRVRQLEEKHHAVLLRFEVADTGVGIAAEAQARLFSAFEQADNSMTRKYGGTGLGLAISKRLVELMGGDIDFESRPDHGSTFWFMVYLQRGGAAVAPAPTFLQDGNDAMLLRDFFGARILLAEDEPINREVSIGMLEDVGLHVDIAMDGVEALALARKNSYAVILMDVQMPQMNGLEATRAIRADSLNRNTPILAMTANAFEEDRQACFAAGMNDHIAKPLKPGRLFEVMHCWLTQPRET
jgi:hypothetical protein